MPSIDIEVRIDRFRKAGLTFDPRLSLRPEHGVVRPFHAGIRTCQSSFLDSSPAAPSVLLSDPFRLPFHTVSISAPMSRRCVARWYCSHAVASHIEPTSSVSGEFTSESGC